MSRFARRVMAGKKTPGGGGGGTGTITHGDQVTTSNVGYTAYYDAALGRTLQLSDLTPITGEHYISDFAAPGDTLYKMHFGGGTTMDIDNVHFVGCRFDGSVRGYYNGNLTTGWTLDYCTFNPPVPDSECLVFQGYTATRCIIQGCMDGAKANGGGTTFIECYVRTSAQSSLDHNDGIQNVGGAGPLNVIRCNIDGKPDNAALYGLGDGNSALFLADGETGLQTIHDNLLAGGGYCVCMYDTGTFDVQGNKFVRGSFSYGTHAMAGPGSGPQNVTWGTIRTNTYSDNGQVIPL